MQHFPSDTLIYKSGDDAMNEWARAKAVLKANPRLMTSRILLLTLHNKPPLHVVQFMLNLNPQAASIPKQGPTALQVAVRYYASVEVIVWLLKACPFALIATNLDDSEFKDPLDCAMELRATEEDLIGILSQPLSFWLNESHKDRLRKEKAAMRRQKKTLTPTEKKELDNIKVIAATTVKAQKRQIQALEMLRLQIKNAEFSKSSILKEVDEHQEHHFKAQLIALDMKEKVLRQKHLEMERRIIKSLENAKTVDETRYDAALSRLEDTVNDFEGSVQEWKDRAEERIRFLECRLAQECKMNDFHRKDTRLQLDQMGVQMGPSMTETKADEPSSPPFVFAIPMSDESGDSDSDEPLFPQTPVREKRPDKFWSPRRNRTPWLSRIMTPTRAEYEYME